MYMYKHAYANPRVIIQSLIPALEAKLNALYNVSMEYIAVSLHDEHLIPFTLHHILSQSSDRDHITTKQTFLKWAQG